MTETVEDYCVVFETLLCFKTFVMIVKELLITERDYAAM